MRAALCFLLLCVAVCHGQSTNRPSTPQPSAVHPTTRPHLPGNSFNSSTAPGGGESNPFAANGTWANGLLHALNGLLNSAVRQPTTANNSAALNSLTSQLPALLNGLAALDLKGNDSAEILANLFSDRRAAGIPAWIEALTQGSNMTQTLNNVQALLKMLSTQNATASTQALLATVFSDVAKGLQSLNLSANSTLQDVISAVMKDPALASSLSQDALEMLSALTGGSDPQALMQQVFPVNPNSTCAADLQTWVSSLQSRELWAFQMLDATGKLQAGLFTGQLLLVGDYDECMDISHTINTSHVVEGLLCGVAFTPPPAVAGFIPQLMGMHLCLPKSCNEVDIYFLLQPTLAALGSENRGIECYRPRDPEGDDWFLGVMITIGILSLLCAIGTFYGVVLDYHRQKQKEKQKRQETEMPAVEPNAYINHGYTTNGDAVVMHNGDHVDSKLTNGDAPLVHNGDHVNGKLTNGDASVTHNDAYGGSQLPPDYIKVSGEDQVHLKSIEPVMVQGQNGALAVSVNGTASYTVGNNKPLTSPPSSEEGLASKLLLSFSVLRNGRKLLNCQQNSGDISCLHGIRVLSITWVILGHCFSLVGVAQANPLSLYKLLGDFTYMAIPGGVYAVDTFFLLSGCLSAFLFLRSTQKSGLTVSGMTLYYVHRYWRLTPLYALMIFFYIGIFPYLKKGPYQSAMGIDSETNCRKYWHYNILYVNNVVDDSLNKSCFGWSWYLSNDMQFYFIAPLVLIPWTFKGSWKKLKIIGFALCVAMILTHCIATGVISYVDDLTMFGLDNVEYMEKIYFVPWCRVGPYALGLLLGYALFVTKCKYKLDWLSVLLGWVLATGVGVTVVYVQYDNLSDLMHGLQWNASQQAAYESLGKVLWAGSVAWVIFACCSGYGGFVNTILSWSAWAPLSRLTYGVYLVHLVVLPVLAGNFKKPYYMDGWSVTTLHLAVTVLSFLSAFIFSMLIEAPTLGLEKAVLGKIFRQKK